MYELSAWYSSMQRRCRSCGHDMELQVQLMAPLIPMFAEATEWLGQVSAHHAGPHVEAPMSWDWLTVAISACPCCRREADGSLREAIVLLANEES